MRTLRTDRLLLRGWREDDLEPLVAINADPEVMRYIGDGSVRDRTATAEGLQRIVRSWQEKEFGLFAVEILSTGEFVGWAGLVVR